MKPQKTKNKALELYITNVPITKICKTLHISKPRIYEWRKKGNWDKLREDAIANQDENITKKMIQEQTLIGAVATERILKSLVNNTVMYNTDELIKLAKHGLEVVRPRQTNNNLNITKNDNKIIQVNIPKEVKELINMEREV